MSTSSSSPAVPSAVGSSIDASRPASVSPAAAAASRPAAATTTALGQRPLALWETFLCGGLAGCAAVTVSNVPEVMKTRLQLQGELMKTTDAPKVYRNVLDVFVKTWRNEGLRGVQRGLGPAYAYQVLLNGSRLGFYEPIRRNLNRLAGSEPGDQIFWSAVTAGAGSGIIGATLGNPLYLIKARMQAYSPILPVGAQHHYRNSIHALTSVVQTEGWKGLGRGVSAAMLRTAMGSSVQLPSYNYSKSVFVRNGLMSERSYWTYLAASSVSGVCVCMVMQPADTVLTRMYNQPTVTGPDGRVRGALYSNPIDCLWKTARSEGVLAWYKGTTAHFLRIAPHTVITLVANELILEQYRKFKHKAHLD